MTARRVSAVALAALACRAGVVALVLSRDLQDATTGWAIFGPGGGTRLHADIPYRPPDR